MKDQINAFLTNIDNDITNINKEDPYKVLISRSLKINTYTQINYILTTQLDIKKLESYNKVIQYSYTPK